MSIRNELLAEDNTGCLQLLMRYPPDQSVLTVIDLSLVLGQPVGDDSTRSAAPRSTAAAHSQLGEPSALPDSAGQSTLTRPDSAPAWLIDGARAGKGPGNGSSQGVSGAGAGYAMERRRVGAEDGGVGGSLGTAGAGVGGARGVETGVDTRNNWQHGLDEFARRWESGRE